MQGGHESITTIGIGPGSIPLITFIYPHATQSHCDPCNNLRCQDCHYWQLCAKCEKLDCHIGMYRCVQDWGKISTEFLSLRGFTVLQYVLAYRLLSEQVLSHCHICKLALSETSPFCKFVPYHFFENLKNVKNVDFWFLAANIPINKIALKSVYLSKLREGNVFTCVFLSFFGEGRHVTIIMMHSTSMYRVPAPALYRAEHPPAPPRSQPFCTQTHLLQTCSNLLT